MNSTLLLLVIGAGVAGFVQGLSGFAFGLAAMSFWAWVLEPQVAAAMTVFGALMGQIIAAFSVQRGFYWRRLLPFLLGGLVGVPLGTALLPLLDMDMFKAGLGTFLVLWCPAMLAARKLPRIGGGHLGDAVIGSVGGVMGGFGGFTGTIPTLWCTMRGFDKDEQRAVIQNFNLATLMVTMLVYLARGIVTSDMLPMFAIVAPAMLIPSLLGARVYLGVSEATFRKIVLGLLTASGVALLSSSVPHLLQRLS